MNDDLDKKYENLDRKILKIVHDLRPFETITISKDGFGMPKKIVVLAKSTTILDFDTEK